jgi:hypothetical protein
MAIIPVAQKFHTVSSTVDTVDRGSAGFQGDREIYTMQDIINTVSATGGSIDGSGVQYALPVFTDTNTITNLAIGTAGQVLTSNGAGANPSFQTLAAGLTGVTNSASDSPNSKTALGVNAGGSSETGIFNTSIGVGAGNALTSSNANTSIGYNAGKGVTAAGGFAVFAGYNAGSQGQGSGGAVGVGRDALKLTSSVSSGGSSPTAVGYQAMSDGIISEGNTAFGAWALKGVTGMLGTQNTGLGCRTGIYLTSGSNNVFIGYNAGSVGTGLETGSNNIIIGHDAASSTGSVSNEITLGNSSITVIRAAVTSITSLSDERDKKDIKDLTYGLDFISNLKPREFVWDNRPEIKEEITYEEGESFDETKEIKTEVEFYSENKGKKDFGFIAQEVQAVDNDILRLVYDENPDKLEMSYGKLVPILVKAIQELKEQLDNKQDK